MKVRKTTVIICEGSVTEPNYFHGIADIINKAEGRRRIIIKPKPPLEKKEEEEAAKVELKRAIAAGEIEASSRRRRQPLEVDEEPELAQPPAGYTAQPVNYVWQAQQHLEIHEEAWAVFDLDGHAEQEAAFELAKTEILDRVVDIAFSSISFETWILMHFELCNTAFSKSQCRTQRVFHDCGQNVHVDDCKGKDCTTGYMKVKGYIPVSDDVKHTSYKTLEHMTLVAIDNSLRLRDLLGNPDDCFNHNPITTVDRLTFKLLHLEDDYKWISKNLLADYGLSYTRLSPSLLRITVTNNSEVTRIVGNDSFRLCDLQNEKKNFMERALLYPAQHIDTEIDLGSLGDFDPRFLVLSRDDGRSSIIELQCLV